MKGWRVGRETGTCPQGGKGKAKVVKRVQGADNQAGWPGPRDGRRKQWWLAHDMRDSWLQ